MTTARTDTNIRTKSQKRRDRRVKAKQVATFQKQALEMLVALDQFHKNIYANQMDSAALGAFFAGLAAFLMKYLEPNFLPSVFDAVEGKSPYIGPKRLGDAMTCLLPVFPITTFISVARFGIFKGSSDAVKYGLFGGTISLMLAMMNVNPALAGVLAGAGLYGFKQGVEYMVSKLDSNEELPTHTHQTAGQANRQ